MNYNKQNCFLCNKNEFVLLHDKGRNNSKVSNYACKNCGFIIVLPRLTNESKNKLYIDGEFSEIGRKLKIFSDEKIKQSESIALKNFRILQEYLGDSLYQNKNFLEVGCGGGSFLRYMKAAGWDVNGIEPDSNFSKRGKEIYDIEIENVFLDDYKTTKKFDLISSFHVIEHVDNPNNFLKKINKLLNDDGLLYIECPSIDYMYGKDFDFFFWDVHINTFSNLTLQSFLMKNGFEVLEIQKSRSFVNVLAKKTKNELDYTTKFDSLENINSLIFERKKKLIKEKPSIQSRIKNKIIHTFKRIEDKIALETKKKSKLTFSHLGFHHSKNTGDIALFVSIRKQFEHYLGDIDYKLMNLHKVVDEALVNEINKTDALLIGGGGLFLKDTNKNDISGWQWPCSKEMLSKIKVPIFIYAVGYNRFRGQGEFDSVFTDNVNNLFKKASFIGLRNYGSIENIKKYIDKALYSKINYQPCSTTLLNDYYSNIPLLAKSEVKVIAINIAFDRHLLRYGTANNENKILYDIAWVVKNLLDNGHEVKLVNHVYGDEQFEIWLKAKGINVEHVNLVGVSLEETINEYRKFDLVVGARGHAQMIPFGLNIPIISLISHEKMLYFLKDNKLESNGVELNKEGVKEELLNKINRELITPTDFKSKQNEIRNITKVNFDKIKLFLK